MRTDRAAPAVPRWIDTLSTMKTFFVMIIVAGLALIAAGYALSVGGGLAAVAVNELFMPVDVAQTSPGMVARTERDRPYCASSISAS